MKIQDGCENFCSYCAIPYARGGIKSRRAKDVIDEIKQMVASGVKEVVLAGLLLELMDKIPKKITWHRSL